MAGQNAGLTFWGVRSSPSPGPATAGFGGNTSCVEVAFDGKLAVLDAGTGLRPLGEALVARSPLRADLLFSSTGFNRVCGLPFFAAAFHPGNSFTLRCAARATAGGIKSELARMMTDPVFPVPIDIFNARLDFDDFPDGQRLGLGSDVVAATLPASRGTRTTFYRLESGNWSLTYACAIDPAEDLERLAAFAGGCDLLVAGTGSGLDHEAADAMAVDIATRAGAARLIVTDHAPDATDDDLMVREGALRQNFLRAGLAREGERIDLTADSR